MGTYLPNICLIAHAQGVSSLKHLLVKPILRVTVWVVAAVTCLGNGLVLWGRFSSRDENRVHSLVIRNLAGEFYSSRDNKSYSLLLACGVSSTRQSSQ
jgi:hypothetical protein